MNYEYEELCDINRNLQTLIQCNNNISGYSSNLNELVRQNTMMLEVMRTMANEMRAMSTKMDMVMGVTKEGDYYNLRSVLVRLDEMNNTISQKMDDVMGRTEEGRYHNLRTVVDALHKKLDSIDQRLKKLDVIRVTLEEDLMSCEDEVYYNLGDLFMELKSIAEKLEKIEEKI